MNLVEIREELKANLGNRTNILDARYNLWINNSEIELASAFQFFETEQWAQRDLVVGSRLYALPADCMAIYSLRDSTNNRKIIRTGYRKIDNIDYTISSDPTHYIRYANNIMFNFTPSRILTVQLRYCTTLTPMSDDEDKPTLNQTWHEVILLGSEWRGWKSLGEVKRAMVAKNEYIAMVRSRKLDWEVEDSDEEFGMEVVK